MRTDKMEATRVWRGWALAGIAVAGLASIVGSGGGGSAPNCSFSSSSCNPTIGPAPPTPAARIAPERVTLQVGRGSTFTAQVANVDNAAFAWCRVPTGGGACVTLAGATGASYTLTAANLADDGSRLRVTVTGSNGTAVAESSLAVSALPGVSFGDGEFAAADWDLSVTTTPAQGGPTYRSERVSGGGNPDTWYRMVLALPQATSNLSAFHVATAAVYDPAVQGAVYVVDFTEDCIAPAAATTTNVLAFTTPLLQQAGRRYTAKSAWSWSCTSAAWLHVTRAVSLGTSDFVQLDGPACAAGASCPDFSGTAPPLGFGFMRSADGSAGIAAGSIVQGVDNWQVTVWRR